MTGCQQRPTIERRETLHPLVHPLNKSSQRVTNFRDYDVPSSERYGSFGSGLYMGGGTRRLDAIW